LHVELVGFIW